MKASENDFPLCHFFLWLSHFFVLRMLGGFGWNFVQRKILFAEEKKIRIEVKLRMGNSVENA